MKKSALGTALEWAAKIHFDQKWKNGKSSFLHHPLGVASLVLFYGGDEAQATAALLHDTIAANISTKEIEAQFGKEIANLVRAFEDPPEVSTLSNEWAQIKKAYLNKVKALPDRSLSVVLCRRTPRINDTQYRIKISRFRRLEKISGAWKRRGLVLQRTFIDRLSTTKQSFP